MQEPQSRLCVAVLNRNQVLNWFPENHTKPDSFNSVRFFLETDRFSHITPILSRLFLQRVQFGQQPPALFAE
jgi:hypothetical protein